MKKRSEDVVSWNLSLTRSLPLLGHRNWIVISDSAYPAHSNPGIETIATEADHLEVLKVALDLINSSSHIRAKVYLDAELSFIAEQDASGVTSYRKELDRLIGDQETLVLPHDQIIMKLDESAKFFRIMILKSTLAIPYTSVFLELDCGYWTGEAEDRLRASMNTRNMLQK